jgi:hypothetical protein
MIQAMESIRRSVVVAVPQERAFEVFTSGMTGWWPVEVRFVPEGPDRTRVELEHRDLDRFGPDAEAHARDLQRAGRVGLDPGRLRRRRGRLRLVKYVVNGVVRRWEIREGHEVLAPDG